ncbi:MAG: type II toxin-antitoxin system death-on-curing family toxin [Blastocatellia bacterium]
MATDSTRYLTYAETVLIHFTLMDYYGESRYGIFSRELIESALARPRQAAVYENAGIVRQAAHLCYGMIKNHPWIGGNKRTATMLMREFLRLNGHSFRATAASLVEMVLAVEADRWKVDEIETWLRRHVISPS